MKKRYCVFCVILVLYGCDNSDQSEPAIQPLILPKAINFMSPQAETAPNNSSLYSDAGTDYMTDPVEVYQVDNFLGNVNSVNPILCFMDQVQSAAMLNRGPYIAIVDAQQCYDKNSYASENEVEQLEFIVESTRENNQSPHLIRLWYEVSDFDGFLRVSVLEVTISEGSSRDFPFGIFSYTGEMWTDKSYFGGVTGETGLAYEYNYQVMADDNGLPVVTMISLGGSAMDETQGYTKSIKLASKGRLDEISGGSGRINELIHWRNNSESPPDNSMIETAVLFDDNIMSLKHRRDFGDDNPEEILKCKLRNEFKTQTMASNLYFVQDMEFREQNVFGGDRVDLLTEFSFLYETHRGQAHYRGIGLYTEENTQMEIPDGAIIEPVGIGKGDTKFRVNRSPGHFSRKEILQEPLSLYANQEFNGYDKHPVLKIDGNWRFVVDAANDINIVGQVENYYSKETPKSTIDHDQDPTTPELAVAHQYNFSDGDSLSMHHLSTLIQYTYQHDASILPEDRYISLELKTDLNVLHQDLVSGDGSETTLYCYSSCPKGGLTQEDIDNFSGSDDFYHITYNRSDDPYLYSAKVQDGKLQLIDNLNLGAVSLEGLDLTNFSEWLYLRTNNLLRAPLSKPFSSDELYDAPLSYSWSNLWPSLYFIDLSDNSLFVLDTPLYFDYTHDAANDYKDKNPNTNLNHDIKYQMSYSGPGDLSFIRSYGSEAPENVPSLEDGTLMDNDQFIVKGVEKWVWFKETDVGDCINLDVDSIASDAEMALPSNDEIIRPSVSIADRPHLTGDPLVINGEIVQ